MELGILALVAVQRRRPARQAFGRDIVGHVQHQGQVRGDPQQAGQGRDHRAVGALATALIGERRVGEPVADHPHPGGERRADAAFHMLGAGGEMQQRFGRRRPVDAVSEQQPAQQLRALGAARLAGPQHRQAAQRQGVRQQPRLGGFASRLPAFQRDEAAGRGGARVQLNCP